MEGLEDFNLTAYLNCEDKFRLTPLLLCCVNEKPIYESKKAQILDDKKNRNTPRFECLRILLEEKFLGHLNVQTKNPRTHWSCLHWSAFYGDEKSVTLLIEQNVHIFLPDHRGRYPIDLAGMNKHDKVV